MVDERAPDFAREGSRAVAIDRTRLGAYLFVSTVFLGLGDGSPPRYETVVVLDGAEGERWQYPTRKEAEAGHAAVVAWLRGEGRPPP